MTSSFSGHAGRVASIEQNNMLGNVQNASLGYLQGGLQGGLNDLGKARSAYGTGYNRSLSALGEGYNGAHDQLAGISGMYDPYTQGGHQAYSAYNDAIGLNGADGANRARQAFQAGPGYQWQVDQGTDAVARKASALGMTASGNTMASIASLGSNLANQEWGNYLNRLDGQSKMGFDSTGQQAGAMRSLADLSSGYGSARANLATGYGGNIAGTYGQAAGLRGQVAGQQSNLVSGIGQQMSQNLGQGLMAGQQAAGNRMNAMMAGGQMLANLAGTAMGMPSGGSMGKMGGGGASSGKQFEWPASLSFVG